MRVMSTRNHVRLPTPPRTGSPERGSNDRSGDPSAGNRAGSSGQTVNGAEIAVGVLVFFLIGWGLDSWWGTTPVAMVLATVFGTSGYFIRTYYAYTQAMTSLEKERSSVSGGRR